MSQLKSRKSAMDASLDRIVRALDAMLHDSHAASFDADFERRHPRGQPDNAGKFARKGQGQGGQREAGEPDKAAAEPAKASAPPKLPFRPPPPPQGIAGARKAGGFSATGKTNTEIGDMAEKLAQKLKIKSLLRKTPEGKIIRQNPLDAEYDDSGWAFEIKAMTTQSTEYKIRMHKHEVQEKLTYAKRNGLRPASMMIVMDLQERKMFVYWREGIANYRLTSEFHYLGEVAIPP